MFVERAPMNPLISPAQVTPSSPDLRVTCAFNAAALAWGNETILLLRVAEAPAYPRINEVSVPIVSCDNGQNCITIQHFHKDSPDLDCRDPRGIIFQGERFLTTLSHLRLARSRDGFNFTIDEHPTIFPSEPYEGYGIEDPRMTLIEGRVYITYTAVSRDGVCVALASTSDFKQFTKHGVILPPENKNVVIFPERIRGKYMMIHRPTGGGIGGEQMWLASSPDLLNWGEFRPLMAKRCGMWDSIRVGAGAVPIKTPEGWLEIYHGVNAEQGYCLGAVLLDLDDPSKIIARSALPLLYPEASYELNGFYRNVVFTCGALLTRAEDYQEVIRIYYGAVDETTCCVDVSLEDVLDRLLSHAVSREQAPVLA